MPVDEPNTIDIAAQADDGKISLVISDHLDWKDSSVHQSILQTKLNTYLRFLESGEVFERFPSAPGQAPSVEIVFRHKPDRDGRIFLDRACEVFQNAGFSLTHRQFADSYNN